MNDDRKKLENKILWCARQAKGIKLISSNENLCEAYLKKANISLKAMNLSRDAKIYDWAVDAAYYARYHAVYALLQKFGIKSEIHDCSLMLIRFLFSEKLSEDMLKVIETAKKQRIDLVYYTDRILPEEEIKKNIETAPSFVLTIEKLISEVNEDMINIIRKELKKTLHQ